jgi:hypothetical protein
MSAMVMPVYEFHILFQQVYGKLASGRYYLGGNSKRLYLSIPFFTVHGHEYNKHGGGKSQLYMAVKVRHLHEDVQVQMCTFAVSSSLSLYILLN